MARRIPLLSSIDDPFYRYQMDSLQITIIKKRTNITNLTTVAKQLARSPSSIIGFLAKRLGTGHNKNILNGVHSSIVLQELLEEYIRHYIICSHCDNPETTVVDQVRICAACGGITQM